MSIQFVIDLALEISPTFRVVLIETKVVLVKFENEDLAIEFVKRISIYDDCSVSRNSNEVLVTL